MNIPLTIVGFIILAIAAFINFNPDMFVKRYINEDNIEVNPEYGFNEEEKVRYRHDMARIKIKKTALLVLLAGIIIIFIASIKRLNI